MWPALEKHLNFYRIHLLCFIVFPVIFSGVFYASNGRFRIAYIDAVFVCVSAVTGTGLSTVDLSSLTAWQQTILVILEIVGNQVFVSWIVVYIRRYYFLKHLGPVIQAELQRTMTRRETFRSVHSHARLDPPARDTNHVLERKHTNPLRPDMVRRVDVALKPVDPNGVPSTGLSPTLDRSGTLRKRAWSTATTRTSEQLPEQAGPSSRGIGFGGFPGPGEVLGQASQRLLPSIHRRFQQTLTIPRTSTLVPTNTTAQGTGQSVNAPPTRVVPYLSFRADVGKNSRFKRLSEEQLLELGGLEYSALNALMWIVPLYYFGLLALAIIIVTPYMALPRWRDIFLPPNQHRKISPIWFSVFQIAGAWANTGMSLVDQNMIPFQTAYLLIFVLFFCVLAGNTAFPVFFRFIIWTLCKLSPKQSHAHDTLKFLLDHPRRCFISMFPSPQTWLLFFVLFIMNVTSFAGDLILNIGNPATDSIPIGTRIALAILSSAAVRSAGFQGVAISSLTPATQVLYLVMMYIAVYPVAMSVRSTNVYEEHSLGIYPEEEEEPNDDELDATDGRVHIWGMHLMRHLRHQLSFDMWWLALTLFLLCIIERYSLVNLENATWFNIFSLIFEIVSGYGTVGLSLGIPTANYSLSGAFHRLSKLILCAIMLRGRHRGLPVALDRAVMLPHEFRKQEQETQAAQADSSGSSTRMEKHSGTEGSSPMAVSEESQVTVY